MACFDSLGVGALIAVAHTFPTEFPRLQRTLERLGVYLGVPLLITTVLLIWALSSAGWIWIFPNLAYALVSGTIVSRAAVGYSGTVGWILRLPPLRYVGQISYGVYVLHLPIREMMYRYGWGDFLHQKFLLPNSLLIAAATLVVASISWHLFEHPINRLKRYLEYSA
jgi:peptidoglycan/LPS O-acetylase OafA/YrhL